MIISNHSKHSKLLKAVQWAEDTKMEGPDIPSSNAKRRSLNDDNYCTETVTARVSIDKIDTNDTYWIRYLVFSIRNQSRIMIISKPSNGDETAALIKDSWNRGKISLKKVGNVESGTFALHSRWKTENTPRNLHHCGEKTYQQKKESKHNRANEKPTNIQSNFFSYFLGSIEFQLKCSIKFISSLLNFDASLTFGVGPRSSATSSEQTITKMEWQ